MTSPSLIFGAILLAFSPTFSLLFSIIFPKPQLVILAVCAAFAYLLSALLSSLVWLIITKATGDYILNSSIGTLLALAIPGVISQMILRCFFVLGYFKVEHVIRRSVAKHEEETLLATTAAYPTTTTTTENANGTSGGDDGGEGGSVNNNNDTHAETNALQLQLNDISCSLASGCGYAIMHSLFLYGTLVASESGEANSYDEGGGYAGGGGSTGHGGTLYQESCGGIPSLLNGALIANMFSILDVMWMMLSFYGMRRRSSSFSSSSSSSISSLQVNNIPTIQATLHGLLTSYRGFDDSPSGGNASIAFVTLSHLAASLVLAPNGYENGCKISLPCLGIVMLYVGIVLRGVYRHFLPQDQRRRIQGMQMIGLRNVDQSHHVE